MSARCLHRTRSAQCERIAGHVGWHRHMANGWPMEWRNPNCPDSIATSDECACAVGRQPIENADAPVRP